MHITRLSIQTHLATILYCTRKFKEKFEFLKYILLLLYYYIVFSNYGSITIKKNHKKTFTLCEYTLIIIIWLAKINLYNTAWLSILLSEKIKTVIKKSFKKN